jgi:soluble lytic murein transglycosylase
MSRSWQRALLTVFVFISAACTGADVVTGARAQSARPTNLARSKRDSVARRGQSPAHNLPSNAAVLPAAAIGADLRPLAWNLLDKRTPEAYSAVETYSKKNEGADSAALAWFTVASARLLDRDYAKALDALGHARFQSGVLDDYVAYQRARAFSGLGCNDQVGEALKDFHVRHGESLLKADVALLYAKALLASGRATEAVGVLKPNRSPGRTDLELALGRAYVKVGDVRSAALVFQRIYYGSPLTADADVAESELKVLETSAKIPRAPFSERRARAEMLLQGGRGDRAVQALRELQPEAPHSQRTHIDLLLARGLLKSGQRRDAKELLEQSRPSTAEEGAERAYRLLEIARSAGDEKGVQNLLNELRTAYADSPWLDRALLSVANMAFLEQDADGAIARFTELSSRFPSSPRASYASWKASWLAFRLGRISDAKAGFEKQVRSYPASSDAPAALYWRARIAEEENQSDTARAWFTKLLERFPNHYYAQQAQARLDPLGRGGALPRITALGGTPPLPSAAKSWQPPQALRQSVRLQKSRLLENAGLVDFAINELQALSDSRDASWVALELARLYQDAHQYHRALSTVRKMVPSYYSLPLTSLPQPVRSGLFPLPYWQDVTTYSLQNGIDPVLTIALIRQESEFNPRAMSPANAVGLMQLLPSTAVPIARSSGLTSFSPEALLEPSTNIQLGTRHFATLLKRFEGTPEYALAAYNAGANRVRQWLDADTYRDVPEFVESIPFSETREYVKAIVRNVAIYQSLYVQVEASHNANGE